MWRRPKDPKPWMPPTDRPARILLVRLSAIGDVLNALPVLSALRGRFPEAHIDWVIEDRSADLLADRPDMDHVIEYPRKRLSRGLRGRPDQVVRTTTQFLRRLRETRYDVALDLQGNLKSGAIARAARAGLRYGLDRSVSRESNHLFSDRRWAPPPGVQHRVDLGLGLASALVGAPLPYVPPGFPVSKAKQTDASALLTEAGLEPGRYVVLHPGTSGFGAFKRWPPERFGALAAKLGADGQAVCVTHGPGERDLALEVARSAGPPSGGPVVAVVGPSSLGALAEVIRGARLFVGADTGPLHLAGLVETPLIGLFGPKAPAVYGPYGRLPDGTPGVLTTLVQDDVACRPCALRRCADPLCMRTLAPERVHAAARRLLAQVPG